MLLGPHPLGLMYRFTVLRLQPNSAAIRLLPRPSALRRSMAATLSGARISSLRSASCLLAAGSFLKLAELTTPPGCRQGVNFPRRLTCGGWNTLQAAGNELMKVSDGLGAARAAAPFQAYGAYLA